MIVFGLVDPRDQRVRFVGTTQEKYLTQRLSSHACGYNVRTKAWASELKSQSVYPDLHILRGGSEGEWISILNPDLNSIPQKAKISKKIRRSASRKELREYMRQYRKKNRKKIKTLYSAWRKRNPGYRPENRTLSVRKYLLKKRGLTPEQFSEKARQQNGRCIICSERPMRLVIDHCHESGRTRGLVCTRCNSVLGFARDRVDVLLAAVEYLRRNGVAQ